MALVQTDAATAVGDAMEVPAGSRLATLAPFRKFRRLK